MKNKKPSEPTLVKIGTHVDLELVDRHGEVESLSVEIVEDQAADFEAGLLGAGTPIAKCILGQPAGCTIPYRAGDLAAVRILAVRAGQVVPDAGRSKRREEVIQKAVSDSERTNATLFASSFSGKWGDYDPDGIENWDQTGSGGGKEGEQS